MLSGFELNQLLMPVKSGAVCWLAAAVTTGAARAASSQMPGMTAPVDGDADQCGGDGEQFESHGSVLR